MKTLEKSYGGGYSKLTLKKVVNAKGEVEVLIGSSQLGPSEKRDGRYQNVSHIVPLKELQDFLKEGLDD